MTQEQLKKLEDDLWAAADKLRADSGLKASQYSAPILGLIFLRFASIRYKKAKTEIEKEFKNQKGRNQKSIDEIALLKCGFYLPPEAEYDYLLNLPEKENIVKKIKQAMEAIETYKPELSGSLPKDEYFDLILKDRDNPNKDDFSLAKSLLKTFKDIPEDATGDVFGKVYEFFLGAFAMAEGQGGGDFYTPTSVVRLMVEIIEPYSGTIYDPACGSGGMFVQSSNFIDRRREELNETDTKNITVYGNTKDLETVKIARMNIAVNGLRGQIVKANTYYEDPFDCYGKFDYILANPPFNVDDVNLDRVKEQRKFNEYGIPQNKTKKSGKKKNDVNTVPNANYLWINLFASSLKPTGRAALVMANSASDGRNSEADIRKNLVKKGLVEAMLTLPKNMFYTVTLPATLWFFDKRNAGKINKNVLFVDARNIFRQIDRAHREFTEEHIQNITSIFRMHRGDSKYFKKLIDKYTKQASEFEKQTIAQGQIVSNLQKQIKSKGGKELKLLEKNLIAEEVKLKELKSKQQYFLSQITWLTERFPLGKYEDIVGLCKAASLAEIEEQEWSLNPSRYVGVVIEEDGLTEEEFLIEMAEKHQKLFELNKKAINVSKLIEFNTKLLLVNE
ncbi:MAG: methylase [Bacteroidetes bacterium]|jgi:type I restriction enzyme M protein|nr:methylase [Bacteroidota bacterium]